MLRKAKEMKWGRFLCRKGAKRAKAQKLDVAKTRKTGMTPPCGVIVVTAQGAVTPKISKSAKVVVAKAKQDILSLRVATKQSHG